METKKPRNRMPAYLDLAQSITGIILALFISGHILFESSILISKEAMYNMTLFFEGYFFFGERYPFIITLLAASILLIIVVHVIAVFHKFPSSYRQFTVIRKHMKSLNHHDTYLWAVQVITGFAMFFLASVHLYTMISTPDQIGPYASSQRVVSDMMWPLYFLLLFAVVIHAGVGVYRLIIKWGFFEAKQQKYMKQRRGLLRTLMYFIITLYLVIGVTSLFRYMQIGYEHDFEEGERYHPGSEQIKG